MRSPHYLRPNRNVELPNRCVIFDTETKSTKIGRNIDQANLWFGYAAYFSRNRNYKWAKNQWLRFTEPEAFWDWIEGKCLDKTKLYVFAHNVAFDLTVTKGISSLIKRGWTLKGAIMDDPPTVIRFQRGKKYLCFIDTLNIFRMPLAEVGKFVGLDKMVFPKKTDKIKIWDAYCMRDCEVLISALQKYWSLVLEWDLGNFQYTLPAQAFTSFRHKFMKDEIFIDDNERALKLARDAYYGGRVEAFKISKIQGTVHCLDINSEYPYVMSKFPCPTKLISLRTVVSVDDLKEWIQDYLIVADVEIDTEVPLYPLRKDGRLLFPVGKFRTQICTWEILEGLKRGHIKRVYKTALYLKAFVFKEYVKFWWNRRRESIALGDFTKSWLCKLFLNSLYGKFGQTGRVYEDFDYTESDEIKTWLEWDKDDQIMTRYRQIGGKIQILSREGESRESHPAIAAHVASAARMYLFSIIEKAGKGNVYYTDTDSLMVSDEGLENIKDMIDPDTLGSLKVEWADDDVEFRGAKDYSVGGKDKIKGIKERAVQVAANSYIQSIFRGFKGMIRDGDLDRMLITSQHKTLTRRYWKGYITPSGWVEPIRFPLPLQSPSESLQKDHVLSP